MRAPIRLSASLAAVITVVALGTPGSAAAGPSVPRELRAAAAPRHELDAGRRIVLPGGAVIERFHQRVGGKPVLGAEAITSKEADGSPRLVADTTSPTIAAPGSARISRRQAIAIAKSGLDVRGLRGPASARLAIQPGDGGALVWQVRV